MKLLLVLAAAAPLFGQTAPCTFTISPSGMVTSAAATDTSNPKNIPSFGIATQANCPFVAVSTVTWLHVLAPSTGSNFVGSSQVFFTFDQNTTTQLRSGQIQVYAGTQATPGAQSLTYDVVQIAGVCTYAISPSSASLPVTGGTGSLTLSTGCMWSDYSDAFITTTNPNGTIGTGPINYQVSANPCAAPRIGHIFIQTNLPNPPAYQINQDGAPGNFTLSTNSVTAAPGALTNQRVTVTTGSSCYWTTYSDSANWLHTTGAPSGYGPASYIYSVDVNQGAQRTGHIFFQSGSDLQGNPLLAATLTITQQAIQAAGPVLTSVANDASYDRGLPAPAPVSPGEIVALFGANLGPAAAMVSGQTFGTSLGGVQVMFGNTAAPLIYVSATQINAVVPYSLSGSSVAVTVQYSSAVSPALTVPVQAVTPGIFSYDSSGTGPGAILNQDFGLNSAARPAAVGSVVAIYCTGAGVAVPASKDGALATSTPPFPALAAQPVTVSIGGVSAQVVYAGPAPGLINGLTQIDAVVPAGVKSGPSVPVVVTIGGVSSQGNLSMAVQ